MARQLPLSAMPPRRRGSTLWVGLSGGLDSTVLLHSLSARKLTRLRAVHIHHGLQAGADDWADHCRTLCAMLGVELEVIRVRCEVTGQGQEAAAREARYQAIQVRMGQGDIVAVAHHQGDQAETVLMRLLRGTGPTGLAAMRPVATFTPGFLWRPMLGLSRDQIERHAQSCGLSWIEDPSNQDPRHTRNRLRHEVIPVLEASWPKAQSNLARAAELIAEHGDLMRDLAMIDLRDCAEPGGPLAIRSLLSLSVPRRNNLVRHWVAGLGLPTPYRDTLERLGSEVLNAAPDASPVLAWPGGEFRRYRDGLFAMTPLPKAPEAVAMTWNGLGELALPPGCGRLRARGEQRTPVMSHVRLVRPGERFKPLGSSVTRTLKNLFQERGVPNWVRARTPVVERDGQVVWVGGIGGAATSQATYEGVEIDWLDRPPAASPDF